MLTLAYHFFLVMFLGDLAIGIWQEEMTLILTAMVMCLISSIILIILHKKKSLNN